MKTTNIFKIALLIISILIVSIKISNAQCSASISASPEVANCGNSTVQFDVGFTIATTFDFNSGTLPTGWVSSPYTVGSPCYTKTPDNSPYFWATTLAADYKRWVVTNGVNVSAGGNIIFDMRFGSDDPSPGCEDPDYTDEGVYLQYSNNGGNWINIQNWVPNYNYSGPLYQWNVYTVAIPTGAVGTNTRFRWYQPSNSGSQWDNWGLDDITIQAGIGGISSYSWNFGDGSTSTAAQPTHTYLATGNYNVSLTLNFFNGCTATANKTVTVVDNTAPIFVPYITPALPKSISMLGRKTDYSNVKLNGGTNFINVAPGASVNLTANWVSAYDGGAGCPGCITQHYIGITGVFSNCHNAGSGSGSINENFVAPSTPGVYYITQTATWWYYCNQFYIPGQSNDPNVAIAVIVVGTIPNACPVNMTVNVDAGQCYKVVTFPELYASDKCSGTTVTQTSGLTSGSQFPVGTTTNTFVATDASNNSTSCSYTITVTDNIPPVATCHNLTINLNSAGTASITAAQIDNGSTDNCGIASRSISKSSFDCSNIGTNNVILTVTDTYGNSAIGTSTVTVENKIAPNAICQNVTVNLDANGSGDILNTTTLSTLFVEDWESNSHNDGGTNLTNWNVLGGNVDVVPGNSSDPVIDSWWIDMDGNAANGIIETKSSFNLVGGETYLLTYEHANNQFNNSFDNQLKVFIGSYSEVFTPPANNLLTEYKQAILYTPSSNETVKIKLQSLGTPSSGGSVLDNIVFSKVTGNFAINNGSNANCGIRAISAHKTYFTCADKGTNPVTMVVTANNGLTSNCNATVRVITSGPGNISNGILAWLDASDVDNDANPTNDPANNTSLNTWKDKSGNDNDAVKLLGQGTFVSSSINSHPVVSLSGNSVYNFAGIDIRANANPDISIITVYRQKTSSNTGLWGNDNTGWDRFMYTNFSSVGATNGIASRGPTQDPAYTAIPGSGIVGKVYLFTAIYDGNVSGGVNNGPANGSSFYFNGSLLGTFTDGTDASAAQPTLRLGFDGDDGYFNGDVAEMIVYNRVLTPCEIQNINVYLSTKYGITFSTASITPGGPTTLCQGSSVTLNANTGAGFSYQWKLNGSNIIGANAASYSATLTGNYTVDVTNNCGTATSAATSVTVNSLPVISCPSNITVNNTLGLCGANVSYSAATVTGLPTPTITYSHASGSFFQKGTTTVTATATNSCGNASCTFTVKVVDSEKPTIATLSAISVNADAEVCTYASSQLTKPIAADNCSVLSIVASPASLTLGANTVTWTATDGSGLTQTSTQTVTVVDTQKPTIATLSAISVNVDDGVCTYASSQLTKPIAADNCSVLSIVASPASLTLGANTITWTATDGSDLTQTSTQTVTVVDTQKPTIATLSAISVNADDGVCTYASSQLTKPIAADNCSVLSIVASPASLALGANTVTWTATDGSGLTQTSTQTVTVVDTQSPTIVVPFYPSTAQNIVNQFPGIADGEYTLYLNGDPWKPFKAYCYDMAGTPREYISLQNTGGSNNRSQETAGGAISGTTVNTNWTKVRLDPSTLRVNIEDYLFSSSTGIITGWNMTRVPYGYAGGCSNGSANGQANVNLTGTSFAVNGTWIPVGWFPVGTSVISSNNQIVNITGGGYCGDNRPSGCVNSTGFCLQLAYYQPTYGTTLSINSIANITQNSDPNICGAVVTWTAPVTKDNCSGTILSSNHNPGETFPLGTTTVTYTATDASANVTTQSFTITVTDATAPTAIAQNVTVQLDAGGNGSTTAALVDNGSSDACGIQSLVLSKTAFSCSDIATNPNQVTLTVTDNNGNVSTTSANVTVVDEIAPIAIAQNVTVQLDASGNGSTTADLVDNGSSDACGIASIALDKTSFTCDDVTGPIGPSYLAFNNSHTYTGISAANLPETNFTIEYWFKTTNPKANIFDVTGSDTGGGYDRDMYLSDGYLNARIISMEVITSEPGNLNDGKWHHVSWTVENTVGQRLYIDGNLSASGIKGNSDFTWAGGFHLGKTQFGEFNEGAMDEFRLWNKVLSTTEMDTYRNEVLTGNEANLLVYYDFEPTGSGSYADKAILGGANNIVSPYATSIISSGSPMAAGQIVTLTVTDNNNNVSTATATVTVEDNVNPIALAQNVIVQLDAAGNGSTTAALVNNGSNDACGIKSLALSKTEFTCSDILTNPNPVTLTVTDNNGNVSTTKADVTVKDEVKPVVVTKNITVQLDADGSATIAEDAVNNGSNDACGGLTFDTDITSFTCSNVGPNTVTLKVTDKNGNFDTKTAVVTVQDNVKPVVVTKNITVQLDADGSATIAEDAVNNGSNDACDGLTFDTDITSFTCSNVGQNTVILKVTDVNGNFDTKVAVVTVEDNVHPDVVCKNITIQLDHSGAASIVPLDVELSEYDACGILSRSVTPNTFDCTNVGPNTVTLTITDKNGNSSSCTAVVTVEDNVHPDVVCKDITIQLDHSGEASIVPLDVELSEYDACGILSRSVTPNTFDCTNVGPNTVTLTITDKNGNASTCTATVTVEDNVHPDVVCKDITIQLDHSGAASIVPLDVELSEYDACGILSRSVTPNTFDCTNVGPNTVTLTITDKNGNSSSCTAVVTVEDNVHPDIVCVESDFRYVDPYQTYYTVKSEEFDATAADACGVHSLTYALSGVTTGTGTSVAGIQLNLGANTFVWTAVDVNGNTSECTTVVTILKRPTTLTYKGDIEEQYSDQTNLSATLIDVVSGSGVMGKTITFTIGTQSTTAVTNASGVASTTLVITQAPGNYNVTCAFAEDGSYLASADSDPFTITREDARVNFTGTQLVATQSSTSGLATVTLRATVQDISATSDAGGDTYPGDIRNARVKFTKIEETTITDISGWLTPTLVNSADLKTGVVSYNWEVNIGNATDEEFTIGIIVDGYYTRNNSFDNTVVTVYKPVGDFITGGGYVLPSMTAGTYAADPGLKTNFGFNVGYNKSGKNIHGNMNIIFRRTEGGIVHTYQIKANALTSLGVNISNPAAQVAVFVSKANLKDITNPLAPVSLGGNLTLQVNLTDKGEPGSSDQIAISLYDGSTLMYSSNWDGIQTVEMLLAGGNLVVHSGLSLGSVPSATAFNTGKKSAEIVTGVDPEFNYSNLKVYPNPFSDRVRFEFISSEDANAQIDIYDMIGRKITTVFEGPVESGVHYNAEFIPQTIVSGMYMYRMTLGDKVYIGKIVYDNK